MPPGTPPSPAPADGEPVAHPVEVADAGPTAALSRGRVWLAALVLAAGYAALRLAMNREFEGAPWDELLGFTAARPFGLRVLVPLLAWPLHTLLRVPTTWVLGLFELIATLALIAGAAAALRPFVPRRWSAALAVLLVLLLPIAFLLQHRWPIFYPYDTPAMAFIAGGVALLLRGRWRAAGVLAFLAALNRESAALVPLAALALHLGPASKDMSRRTLPIGQVPPDAGGSPGVTSGPAPIGQPASVVPDPPGVPLESASAVPDSPGVSPERLPIGQLVPRVLGLVAAVAVARVAVSLVLHDNPGAPVQLFVDGTPRLLANLAWLEEPSHWLRLPAYFGFVPLAWALLHAWMPPPLRRLGWVALAYLGGLMWVANIDEPRVYGEALVLLYLPVAVALARWLRADPSPV